MKTLTACLLLCLCPSCGTTRAQRLQIYGVVLDVTGHPEVGVPLAALGRALEVHSTGK